MLYTTLNKQAHTVSHQIYSEYEFQQFKHSSLAKLRSTGRIATGNHIQPVLRSDSRRRQPRTTLQAFSRMRNGTLATSYTNCSTVPLAEVQEARSTVRDLRPYIARPTAHYQRKTGLHRLSSSNERGLRKTYRTLTVSPLQASVSLSCFFVT
jgi:hypothetical protein